MKPDDPVTWGQLVILAWAVVIVSALGWLAGKLL